MKVIKDVEIWQKVRTEKKVVGEYLSGSFISPEFAFLWNKDIDKKKAMRVLKILVGVKSKKKKEKEKN